MEQRSCIAKFTPAKFQPQNLLKNALVGGLGPLLKEAQPLRSNDESILQLKAYTFNLSIYMTVTLFSKRNVIQVIFSQ